MAPMNSTIVSIPSEDEASLQGKKKNHFSFLSNKIDTQEYRQLIYSIKVGIALVMVSLLYLIDPLYEQVGENAMWAIMTVVVIFEFFAGAVLSKGLNRGMGTILGGVLGCLAATLAQEVGGIGKGIAVGTSVFIFGAAASFFRLVPSIKRRYDYGVLIFILTFNLVAVSGLRGEQVIQLARERLSTIGMGFAISVITSLLICPVWASDELHTLTVRKFNDLAFSIERCLEEYFKTIDEDKDNKGFTSFNGCKSVLHSKAKDEMLANFARWEPWHGKFGFYYPWNKYLDISELLRELAVSILSLKGCLQSPRQPSSLSLRLSAKEPTEAVASILACTLKELGDNIMNMRRCRPRALIVVKLQSKKLELSEAMSASKLGTLENGDGLSMASFAFLLMEMMDKVEKLAKEVEELGDLADFLSQ